MLTFAFKCAPKIPLLKAASAPLLSLRLQPALRGKLAQRACAGEQSTQSAVPVMFCTSAGSKCYDGGSAACVRTIICAPSRTACAAQSKRRCNAFGRTRRRLATTLY